MANITTPPIPSSDTAVLEAFIPGYSLISRFFVTYLHIDPSIYVPYILVGGVLAAALRVIARQARALVEEHFVSTVEIRATDEIYQYLTYWLARQDFVGQSRHVVAGTRAASRDGDEDEDEDEGSDTMADSGSGPGANEEGHADIDFDDYWAKTLRRDKYKPLRYTPAQGTHYFRFRGRYVAFTREVSENGGGLSSYTYFPERAERLYISTLGRGTRVLRELLGEAQRGYVEKDTSRTVIYRGARYGAYHEWVRCMARTPRPLSTVVLDEAQKGAFVADVKEYLHPRTRRWYSNRGIPYRRGYLLHGPAGTGKTSLCAAAAGLLGLKLYLLSLGSGGLDEDGLVELFLDLPSRCIVLLEDVDSAVMSMKRGDGSSAAAGAGGTDEKTGNKDADEAKPKGISLSAILNVIDGVAATEGRILVMTTNHPEKLDPALLRPGRVDMSIEFGYADKPVVQELFSSIYSCLEGEGPRPSGADGAVDKKVKMEASGRDNESVLALAREFASRVPAGALTAAEIQGYLLNHKGKPEDALERAPEWVKSVQEKRASG